MKTKIIAYATALFSLVYGVAGLYWAFGATTGYPFGTGDPELMAEPDFAFKVSLLGESTPQAAGPWIAALGLAGALAAVLMARGAGRGALRWTLIGFGAVAAAGLAVVVQDYRTLIVVAYTPILAVSKPFFGWPQNAGFGDLYLPPRLNLVLCTLAGIAWALTTVAYWRRTSASAEAVAAAGRRVAGWGRPAVAVAFVVPMIYCATRWLWALGLHLGMPEAAYEEGRREGLWLAGAGLATLGLGGAILTLGLVQRWGERFPRWMLGLAGRRVPIMLAVVPAVLVSVMVVSSGFMYIRKLSLTGLRDGAWVADMPETLWPVWGAALFVAAIAYHQRRRITEAAEKSGETVAAG